MINKLGNVNMSNSRQKSISNRKYDAISSRETLQCRVAQDIKRKNNDLNYHFNIDDYNRGIKWFENGLSLDDASEEMLKNVSFVNGFKRGRRVKIINEQLYNLGKECFENGTVLEDIPANYRVNEMFMNGYNDASNGRHR